MDATKILPYNLEAEKSVLGGILLDQSLFSSVSQTLNKPDFFYLENYQIIFRAIYDLAADHQPIDIISLSDKLKKLDCLEKLGGIAFLNSLTDDVVASEPNVNFHAEIIREKYIRRELNSVGHDISSISCNQTIDFEDCINQSQQLVFEVTKEKSQKSMVPLNQVIKKNREYIDKLLKGDASLAGLETGYKDLDNLLSGGFQKSTLIILAALTSVGKTTLALNIAANVANRGIGVGVFSLEMSAEELGLRLWASEARVNIGKFRRGEQTAKESSKLVKYAHKMGQLPIHIDDSSKSLMTLMGNARQLLAKHNNVGLIVIDYLQLMEYGISPTGQSKKFENFQREVATISRALKLLANELKVPLLVLSQLSRKPIERGKDKRPMLSDLRDSGAIEQDADMVIFLHRDDYFDKEKKENDAQSTTSEVIIQKNRNGQTGTIKLNFFSQFTRFDAHEPNY